MKENKTMTEEELTEKMDKDLKEVFNVKSIMDFQFDLMQKAYLKGIETGQMVCRPKWHDLRKNPDDLPPNEHEVYICLEYQGSNGIERHVGFDRYLDADKTWFTSTNEEVIAWCEIPKYTED